MIMLDIRQTEDLVRDHRFFSRSSRSKGSRSPFTCILPWRQILQWGQWVVASNFLKMSFFRSKSS